MPGEFLRGILRRKKLVIWSVGLVILQGGVPFGRCAAQDEAAQAAQQLERLRREIRDYEKRISDSRTREKDLLGELDDFDREITLRGELIGRLEKEKNRAQAAVQTSLKELHAIDWNIEKTRGDSLRTARERDGLADLVSKRTVYTYKNFHRDVLKAVLTSQSFVQMLTRQEYLRRIAAADRQNLQRLDQKNRELAAIGDELSERQSEASRRLERYRKAAKYQQQILEEENSEAKLLKARRIERESLLNRVRQDRQLLSKQLEEKKLAAQRVESLIRSLEAERESRPIRSPVTWAPELPFDQLRGKLNWPTAGRIVSRFGLQRHEKLSTVTENPGIDIEADEGSPVLAVSAGQVTKITWLRGYGNTVILDHRDGYYTVYAHLAEIHVREGQVVSGGETIGQVGQSGTLSGPRLHFELWAKRVKQDPADWLVSR